MALTCSIKIIVPLVSVFRQTRLIGITVRIVDIRRFAVPKHSLGKFLSEHIQSRVNIDLILSVISIAQINPSGLAVIRCLAESTAHRSHLDNRVFGNSLACGRTSRRSIKIQSPQSGIISVFVNKGRKCVGIAHCHSTDFCKHSRRNCT